VKSSDRSIDQETYGRRQVCWLGRRISPSKVYLGGGNTRIRASGSGGRPERTCGVLLSLLGDLASKHLVEGVACMKAWRGEEEYC